MRFLHSPRYRGTCADTQRPEEEEAPRENPFYCSVSICCYPSLTLPSKPLPSVLIGQDCGLSSDTSITDALRYTPNWSCVAFSKSYRDNCLHHNWASFLKLRLSREGWMPSGCLPGINSLEYLADTRPDSQKGMYVEEVGLLP